MKNITNAGRIFFGIAIAGLGLLTILYRDFPYMLIPMKHSGIPGLAVIAIISGILMTLAGLCIIIEKQTRLVSLILGVVLLLIFCLYFVPYQLMAATGYTQLVEWENSLKELSLCGGAFVVLGLFLKKDESPVIRILPPLGDILFAITIICYGIVHFQLAKDVAEYVPSWVPMRLFWAYLAGVGLIGGGLAIILKIKVELIVTLLGAMILTWFVILHVPRVIMSTRPYLGSEITSALIALGYSGTALTIARRKHL